MRKLLNLVYASVILVNVSLCGCSYNSNKINSDEARERYQGIIQTMEKDNQELREGNEGLRKLIKEKEETRERRATILTI